MSTSTDNLSILGLAEDILEQSKAITKYLQANNHAAPTYSTKSGDPPTTRDYSKLQGSLRTALEDLQRLIDGPKKFYRHFLMRGYELAAFQVALDFNFFTLIPAEGSITVEDLAKQAGLDQDRTGRIIRMLITHRIFQERSPGVVCHNAYSVALQDEELRSMVHYSFDEMIKAAIESSNSLRADPYRSDSIHCPFHTRHGVPIFEYYSKHPEYAGRFAKAMAGWRRMEDSVTELKSYFPWTEISGSVIDIGGGSGHISIILARLYPHLKFIVQDETDDMLNQGQKLLTDDVRDRISFQKASFFEPQPVKGAAAYLIRQCTHNWADHDVVRMFRAVVPGLEGSAPGTPLLINDIVLPEPGTLPLNWEREMRQADMVMLVSFGAKQRTKKEFEALLKEADPRYGIRKISDEGALGLIEVVLQK
ncbi:S-adenosyl-L-methionine-dependent methyltransferase [Truncatella angustata]|uniref:S-adenosyl-L-methionine-dependent methyltransferase n=1 Tax=Truncatella angustata TaxID=152316 RepID=A0A9P8UFV5_9PEZI|nr:S-adenosyl-L-methionine-dependent methyltransferase [Truncatella angustata]KAH6651431.1 S-adenosyl-L-methionine-dependent methyltransferase [Truncatella angustata]